MTAIAVVASNANRVYPTAPGHIARNPTGLVNVVDAVRIDVALANAGAIANSGPCWLEKYREQGERKGDRDGRRAFCTTDYPKVTSLK